MPELWYNLGDNLLHCGHAMGMRDAWPRSLGAFEKALAIDSGFTPAWEHVPGLLLERGDSARARVAFRAYSKDNPDFAVAWRFLLFADSAERERLIPAVAASRPMYFAIFSGVVGPLFEARQIRFSERVLDQLRRSAVTEAERQQLLEAERVLALNRGQPARAARVGRQQTSYSVARLILDAVFHDGDSALAAEAMVEADKSLRVSQPLPTERSNWTNTVFAAGQYHAAQGRPNGVATASALLRGLRAPADSPWVTDPATRVAMLLDAQYAILSKRPNARRLVADADSMLRDGPPGILTRATGNLIVTRLWEQLGDVSSAYDAARRIYYETFTPFWSTHKRERARLAALTGDTEEAIKLYREYLAIRYDPEPELRPHVESTKRELIRLERTIAGR